MSKSKVTKEQLLEIGFSYHEQMRSFYGYGLRLSFSHDNSLYTIGCQLNSHNLQNISDILSLIEKNAIEVGRKEKILEIRRALEIKDDDE